MYINNPKEIEVNSMKIIDSSLEDLDYNADEINIVKRIIHTTGDVKYQEVINISPDFVESAKEALSAGKKIYVDTKMTYAGANKRALDKLGVELVTYIDQKEIFDQAEKNQTTRSYAAINKAIDEGITCFSVGNAPTALFALLEAVDEKRLKPDFVIGVPVGFVGAAESKEELEKYQDQIPQITVSGTKGGSNVAVSIINALAYMLVDR